MTDPAQLEKLVESAGVQILRLVARPSRSPSHWTCLTIKVHWDLATSVRPDQASKPCAVNMCRKRILTGDEATAETASVEEYILSRWPSLGTPFLSFLEQHFEDVLQMGCISNTRKFEDWPMQGLRVYYFDWRASTGMMDVQEQAVLEVHGQSGAITDLIDALAWLTGAFRCYSSQQLYASEVELRTETNEQSDYPVVWIVPKPLRALRRSAEIQWHRLMSSAVIVTAPTVKVRCGQTVDNLRFETRTASQVQLHPSAQPQKSLKLGIRDVKGLTGENIKVLKYRGSVLLLGKTFILMPMRRQPDGSINWRILIMAQRFPTIPKYSTTFASWDPSRPCIHNDAEQRDLNQYPDAAKLVLETLDSRWPLRKRGFLGKARDKDRERFTEWADLRDAPAHYICSGV